jgi:hypothetical protein
MTAAACGIAGGACSSLLGLDDPKPNVDGGGGDDGGGDDGGPSPERLEFGLGDFPIKEGQRVGVHVTAVFAGGSTEDATETATYDSTSRAIADVVIPGQIDGISAGMATISATIGSSQPGTATVTVLAKSCTPVINEFQTAGVTADDEWVEILNPCAAPATVEGWTLVYRAAGTVTGPDSTLLVALTGTLMPGEFRLYVGAAYTGGGTPDGQWTNGLGGAAGAIGLRSGPKDSGPLADAVAYGTTVTPGHPFIEGASIGAMTSGRSAQRLPFDGHDEGNGPVDFKAGQIGSPRAPNAP